MCININYLQDTTISTPCQRSEIITEHAISNCHSTIDVHCSRPCAFCPANSDHIFFFFYPLVCAWLFTIYTSNKYLSRLKLGRLSAHRTCIFFHYRITIVIMTLLLTRYTFSEVTIIVMQVWMFLLVKLHNQILNPIMPSTIYCI